MLCTLNLAKTTMAECLSKNVPGDKREGGREGGRKEGREEGREGGRERGREGGGRGKGGGEVGMCIKTTFCRIDKQLDRYIDQLSTGM